MSDLAQVTPIERAAPPAVDSPAEKRVELLATLALVCVYSACMSGHLMGIDGLVMYRQAMSITYQHSLHFSTPIWWGGSITTSQYGVGLSLLYVPGLLLWSWLQPYVPVPPPASAHAIDFALLYSDPLYTLAGAPIHILITAASAYLVARFLRELGADRAVALWGLVLYGIASPAIVYARGDASQPLEGLCWIAALLSATRFRRSPSRLTLCGCGLAVGYAVLTRPVEGTLLLPGVLLLMAPHPRFWRWTRPAWLALAVVAGSYLLGVLVTLLVDWDRFGSPFATGYGGEGWTTPLPIGLAGVLVSPGHGILWEFPALFLLPLGLRRLWPSPHRQEALALTLTILLQLLNVATWDQWWGGWDFGARLFLPALPLAAMLSAAGISGLPAAGRRWVPALCLLAGAVWAAPCVVTSVLGGYASWVAGPAVSFDWHSYAPISAWGYLHHWRAWFFADSNAADIMWLLVARSTNNASLVPPALLLLTAAALARRVLSLQHVPIWRRAADGRAADAPSAVDKGKYRGDDPGSGQL